MSNVETPVNRLFAQLDADKSVSGLPFRSLTQAEFRVEKAKASVLEPSHSISVDLGHGPILINKQQFREFLQRNPALHEFQSLSPEEAIKAIWNAQLMRYPAWKFMHDASGQEARDINVFSFIQNHLEEVKMGSDLNSPWYPLFVVYDLLMKERESISPSLPIDVQMNDFKLHLQAVMAQSTLAKEALGLSDPNVIEQLVHQAREYITSADVQRPLTKEAKKVLSDTLLKVYSPSIVNKIVKGYETNWKGFVQPIPTDESLLTQTHGIPGLKIYPDLRSGSMVADIAISPLAEGGFKSVKDEYKILADGTIVNMVRYKARKKGMSWVNPGRSDEKFLTTFCKQPRK